MRWLIKTLFVGLAAATSCWDSNPPASAMGVLPPCYIGSISYPTTGVNQAYSYRFNTTTTAPWLVGFTFRQDPGFWTFKSPSLTSAIPYSSTQLLQNANLETGGNVVVNGNSVSVPTSFQVWYQAGQPPPAAGTWSTGQWYDGAVGTFDGIYQAFNATGNWTYTLSFTVSGTNPSDGSAIQLGVYALPCNDPTAPLWLCVPPASIGFDVATLPASGTPTSSPAQSVSSSRSPTKSVSSSVSVSASPSIASTVSPSTSSGMTSSISTTLSLTPSRSLTLSASQDQSPSISSSSTSTASPTISSTSSGSLSGSMSYSSSVSQTVSSTVLQTGTPTGTSTLTGTGTATLTTTGTPTLTGTGTSTGTSTLTGTGTQTLTNTGTSTLTGTSTANSTGTSTLTGTVTGTGTATATANTTVTPTLTGTGTLTGTPTLTGTGTGTLTGTPTLTGTATANTTLTGTQTGSGSWSPNATLSTSISWSGTMAFSLTGTNTSTPSLSWISISASASPTFLSVTSTPLFMFTPFPTTTSSPTTSANLTAAGLAAVASSNTGTILGGVAVGMVGILGAIMVFMNAPTKTINKFLVNIVNRAPIPDSMKAAIGDDPIGKLKSMRSTLTSPKELVDKLPIPDSVKAAVQNALPHEATDAANPKVTFAPETTGESIVVPVVASAAVVSKTVLTKPEPEVQPEQTLPNKPEPEPEPEVVTRPAASTFSVFSYLPGLLTGATNTDDSKKATIELDASDLAAVQAYLKQKGTDHKVIS